MSGGWVYIMTNHPNGTLYIGITNDLPRRVWEHRQGIGSKFAKRYYLKRLVFAERHDDITAAIQRETSLERWSRAWKLDLITSANPDWDDLYDQLA
jgi:putative endonuclease